MKREISLAKVLKVVCIGLGIGLSALGTVISEKPKDELPAEAIETKPVSVEDAPAETSEPAAE